MENVVSLKKRNKKKPLVHAKIQDVRNDIFEGLSGPIESKHLLISMLLPSAVKAFLKELESEVEQVCGELSKHGGKNLRWGVHHRKSRHWQTFSAEYPRSRSSADVGVS